MAERQSTTPKELADAFDMKVLDFARMTGYSKQGIYQMLKKSNGVCTPRLLSTIHLLELHSEKMYEKDIEKACERKRKREYALKCLKEYLGGVEDNQK